MIEEAIRRVTEMTDLRPVSLIAEYPAHLPGVAVDGDVLARSLADLLTHVIQQTAGGEVRVRAQLMPTQTQHEADGSQHAEGGEGPWAVISIAAVESSAAQEAASPQAGASFEATLKSFNETLQPYGGSVLLERLGDSMQRVWIWLPLGRPDLGGIDLSQLKREVETRLPDGTTTGSRLLLMIEDENIRNLLSKELAEGGYLVMASGEMQETVPLARAEKPDLIVLDLQARAPSAIELARILKQDPKTGGLPVLFLTAIEDPHGGVRMGTANFFVRPEGTGAMLATVNAALHATHGPVARVMVVEPDDALRESMILSLQAHDYAVVEARSSEEAVALAERVRLGLALVNARLAQERDYWLVRQLRQISGEVNILVVAEGLTEEEGRAAIRRGASGYGETGQLPELLDRVRDQNGDGDQPGP